MDLDPVILSRIQFAFVISFDRMFPGLQPGWQLDVRFAPTSGGKADVPGGPSRANNCHCAVFRT